ncbi:hypothetical protein [Neptunicoccus sediminis]|uniref:SLAC1 family transporter n=1 Tax=Neptunicoccus sediminis TaxID=1892596 RepID=UPI000846253A|nr:hypothetical protein [Neptunicoccus sediminis]
MALFNHFWRRTPPALFPSLLGLFGLSLAWRAAAGVWDVPEAVGAWIGLGATLVLLVTLSSYVAKLCIRPGVLWDDLMIDPARGSVSAGSMCAMAMAAFLLPYTSLGAFLVWWMAIGLHLIYFICVVLILLRHHNTLAQVTPVFLLPAAGILVATLAGPELGYVGFSRAVLVLSIPVWAVVLGLSLWNGINIKAQKHHRSGYAVFLVPPALAALGVHELQGAPWFVLLWVLTSVTGLALLPVLRWMLRGGWSPDWGNFCFPLAAFAAVQLLAVEAGLGWIATGLAVASLGAASLLIPYILLRTYRDWFAGRLAEATKAAVA